MVALGIVWGADTQVKEWSIPMLGEGFLCFQSSLHVGKACCVPWMLGTSLDDGHMINTCQEVVQQGLNATLQDILYLNQCGNFDIETHNISTTL